MITKWLEYLFEIVKDHVPSNICAENGQGKLAFILSSNLIDIRTNVEAEPAVEGNILHFDTLIVH